MLIRPLRWSDDRHALLQLDTSFYTDTILRVVQTPRSFSLEPELVDPPIYKAYDLAAEIDDLPDFSTALVAESEAGLVGLAAFKLEAWNRRANLYHFYIDPALRGRGLGRELMQSTLEAARHTGARALWLETQNINYGAIRFYERMGFTCCGLDTSLYESEEMAGEIALFFALSLRNEHI